MFYRSFFFIFLFWIGQAHRARAAEYFNFTTQKTENLTLIHPSMPFTVIAFYNPQCPCSQSHFDHMKELHKKFPQFDFKAINENQILSITEMSDYYKKFNLTFPIYNDINLAIANQLKALKTPHVFVYNNQKQLLYQGGMTDSKTFSKAKKHYLEEVMTALQKGESSPYKETKTLGCIIER